MCKKVYFISDTHLGADYIADESQRERMVTDFLYSIKDDASELYLMGDILDYWFEYRTVVPRGYVRFFGALAALADSGVKITWFIGNHDIWLFDYLKKEIGLEVVDGVNIRKILGKKFLLSHGDGVGRLPSSFRFIRATFRNRVCQKLYAAIHPRWTVGFAHRWSARSRRSEKASPAWKGEQENLFQYAKKTLEEIPDINYFVFGHRHLIVNCQLSPTSNLIILGDWLTNFSYGCFDGTNFEILQYKHNFNKKN